MPEKIILIAAITADGFIAKNENDDLSWTEDKHLFKKQTIGTTIIVGPKTHQIIGGDLPHRKNIVVRQADDPRSILQSISDNICFIIGGAKTYTTYIPFITHLYLTTHPLIFGKGIRLFTDDVGQKSLKKITSIPVPNKPELFQDQYEVCLKG